MKIAAIVKKFLVLNLACLFIGYASLAQESKEENSKKLTKNERIWQAAYDDTTKALAALFIEKRSRVNRTQKKSLILLGVSTVALFGGALMMQEDADDSPTATNGIATYAGGALLFSGTAGILTSGTIFSISVVRLNPYTLKKYYKLIELHRSGKKLPKFYLNRLKNNNTIYNVQDL